MIGNVIGSLILLLLGVFLASSFNSFWVSIMIIGIVSVLAVLNLLRLRYPFSKVIDALFMTFLIMLIPFIWNQITMMQQ